MKDRVPTYPGRVKLTPVEGQENTYDMTRADQPTQAGTPLNKATLLKDETAEKFGFETTGDTTVDDILSVLKDSALYNGTPDIDMTLPAVGITLENATWEQINAVAYAGKGAEYWSLGDEKTITLNGGTYTVIIIGFEHDDLTTPSGTRTKAGITFQLKNFAFSTDMYMNKTATNKGGWTDSYMRTAKMPLIESYMSEDLRKVLVHVDKLTTAGEQSSTINTDSDKVFLLSEIELYGSITSSGAGEGTQYAYYSEGGPTMSDNHNRWLRSPSLEDSMRYVLAGWNPAGPTQSTANSSFSVFGAFCVGRPAKYSGSLTDVKGNLITIPDSQIEGGLKIIQGAYTGTGTSGASNLNSLTFDFAPALIVLAGSFGVAWNQYFGVNSGSNSDIYAMAPQVFTENFSSGKGFCRGTVGSSYARKSEDGKTVYWYNTQNADAQCNYQNWVYYYIAIGYEE